MAKLAELLVKRQPKARILSVSYDQPLMRTRQMLLEREGYEMVSASGLSAVLETCQQSSFDLLILGHSIPDSDKLEIVQVFREACAAPVVSLRRTIAEHPSDGADFHVDPDPEPLLKLIREVVNTRGAKRTLTSLSH